MLIPLQQGILYGPIRSKRLGCSLGLNLFPSDRKVCSFDCVYCHFGGTTDHVRQSERLGIPSVTEVLAAVEEFLKSDNDFDYITFSGNGEPTMYPDFAELVPKLHELIRRRRPSVRLALLSNSSCVGEESLYPALKLIDLPIFKLDAGNQTTFEILNRPCPGVTISAIIDGLTRLSARQEIIIQTVMVDGPVPNHDGQAFDDWIVAIRRIRPGAIQLYTTDRPVADTRVRKVSDRQLETIAARIRELTGVPAQAYY